MSNEKDIETEEYAEALKILDKNIKQMEDIEEKEAKKEKIETEEIPISEEDTIIAQQSTFYLKFFITTFTTLINPILKKYKIAEITTAESSELAEALMGIISNKMLSTTGKIGSVLSKIVSLPNILKLVMVFWKIGFPRISKYMENKKK